MTGKFITLKYAGVCHYCGEFLPMGSRARWYGRGIVYGLDCHLQGPGGETFGYPSFDDMVNADRIALDAIARPPDDKSEREPYGTVHEIYSPVSGESWTSCSCEDYPCCGH